MIRDCLGKGDVVLERKTEVMHKVESVRNLLMWAIREKNKSYLWDARQIVKSMTDEEWKVLLADKEIQEMTIILDRNILPKIDKKHVPYGPPIKNEYEK